MKKKVGTLILAFIFLLSFAACGTGGAPQSTSPTAASAENSSSPTTTVAGPPTQLNVVFAQSAQNLADINDVTSEINKLSQAKINTTVTLTGIPIANFNQQIRLMLTSQEKMDLMLTGTLAFEDYAGQIANKQLLALNDLLDKYGQGIKDALGSFLEGAKVGGNYYAVPSVRDEAKGAGFAIRSDLVDKYKIDLSTVKSLEDLTPIFKVLKENEPDIAVFNPCQTASSGLDVSVHVPGGDCLASDHYFTGVMLDSQDTASKLVNWYETPQAAAMFKLVREWNQAGYIMQGATSNTETFQSLIKAGKVASAIQDVKPGVEGQLSKQCGMPMKVVPVAPAISYTGVVDAFMFAIPTYCKTPDQAMQFLNLLYTDKDIVNLVDWGIEGKHYVKNSDGTIKYPDGIDATTVGYPMNFGFMWGNQQLSYVFEGDPVDLWDQMKTFNSTSIVSKGLGFLFDPTPVKTQYAACVNVWQQYEKALGVGAVDPDKVLPEFISKLKAAGSDAIVAEKQKQFDAWLAAK